MAYLQVDLHAPEPIRPSEPLQGPQSSSLPAAPLLCCRRPEGRVRALLKDVEAPYRLVYSRFRLGMSI